MKYNEKSHYRLFTNSADKWVLGAVREIDLTGNNYGRLTVLQLDGHIGRSRAWLCLCECGNYKKIRGHTLVSGQTKSCGCIRIESSGERNKTHGMAGSKTYRVWSAAKRRCNNPNVHGYYRYGGRGISMCAEWSDSFEAFLGYMGEAPKGLTLDRIDNDGNYEPGNCRWATWLEQAGNKYRKPGKSGVVGVQVRNNKFSAVKTINGKRKHLGTFKTIEQATTALEEAR